MKIVIASDHAGFSYKREIIAQLRAKDITVVDVGTDSEAPVSSVPFVREVAEGVASGKFDRGIVVGGSGNGEAMAANRFKGVRCALCWSADAAKLARQQQDANVLALGERLLDLRTTLAILDAFLNTAFDDIRFEDRVAELDA